LLKELIDLEEKNPEFDSPNSPTKRVGGEVMKEFKKTRHKVAQWSFDNVFNEDEFRAWDERVKRMLAKEMGKSFPNSGITEENGNYRAPSYNDQNI